jgi:hypothetical protein
MQYMTLVAYWMVILSVIDISDIINGRVTWPCLFNSLFNIWYMILCKLSG